MSSPAAASSSGEMGRSGACRSTRPGGAEVAVADGSAPDVELRLDLGSHTLAVTATDAVDHPHDAVGVSLARIGE